MKLCILSFTSLDFYVTSSPIVLVATLIIFVADKLDKHQKSTNPNRPGLQVVRNEKIHSPLRKNRGIWARKPVASALAHLLFHNHRTICIWITSLFYSLFSDLFLQIVSQKSWKEMLPIKSFSQYFLCISSLPSYRAHREGGLKETGLKRHCGLLVRLACL